MSDESRPHTRVLPVPGGPADAVPIAPTSSSALPAFHRPEPIPTRLGGVYEPLVEIAAGGMARVFIGRRVGAAGFERLVVLKQVHRHHLGKEDFYAFFRDEAHIASLIHHANVASVIDVIEGTNELLLVVEYVESASLSQLLRRASSLPAPIALRVMLDVLAGLHAAHELVDAEGRRLDVVHRDVSPQNIIVGRDGVSRVIDFGIAKAAHRVTETQSGDIKGKAAYMAPEYVRRGTVDRRADIFSCGVVLYEAITGKRLFAADSAFAAMRHVVEAPIPELPPLEDVDQIALDRAVRRALERDPDQRFATATELADALERAGKAASHRQVAEFVERHCATIFAERRAALGERRRLGASGSGPVAAVASSPSGASGEPVIESLTYRAATSDLLDSRKPARQRPYAFVALGVVLALGVAGTIFAFRSARGPDGIATSASAPPIAVASTPSASVTAAPSPPPTTPPPEPPSEPVRVEVTAPGRIERIHAEGLVRSEVRGRSAVLFLSPWTGDRAVEARLEDRRVARGVVAANGSRRITLAAPRAAAPAPAPKGVRPAAASGDDLQANPYGP